jgi:hypothetical protein
MSLEWKIIESKEVSTIAGYPVEVRKSEALKDGKRIYSLSICYNARFLHLPFDVRRALIQALQEISE